MFPYWGPVANASALNAYTKEDIKEVKARYLNILKANVRKNKLKLFSDNSDVSETCFKCFLLKLGLFPAAKIPLVHGPWLRGLDPRWSYSSFS